MEGSDGGLNNDDCSSSLSLGEKLEIFYLRLMAAAEFLSPHSGKYDKIRSILDAMESISSHQIIERDGETLAVKEEILKDAQRKTSGVLRPYYVEIVNQLITSTTKRLRTKTALDGDNTNHSQRHIQLLLDLFGQWSNIIQEVGQQDLTKENIQYILTSLSSRVSSLAWDILTTFKQDKEINLWCDRMISWQNDFNLHALDNLINQVTMMRSITNQYYQFLHQLFANESSIYLFHSEEIYQHPLVQSLEGGSGMATMDLLLISNDDRMRWRELDMIYTTLESGYMIHSTLIACRQATLLEVEEGVWMPQLVEDTVYLLNKIIERSLSMSEEQVVFLIGQKVLDVIVFDHLLPKGEGNGRAKMARDASDTSKISIFCTILLDKVLYYQSSRTKRLNEKMLHHLIDALTHSPSVPAPSSHSQSPPHSSGRASALSSNPPLAPASSSSLPASLAQHASALVAGIADSTPVKVVDEEGWNVLTQAASTWISTWTSPFLESNTLLSASPYHDPTLEEGYVEETSRLTQGIATPFQSAPSTPQTQLPANTSAKMLPPVSSNASSSSSSAKQLSMEELLLQALDLGGSSTLVSDSTSTKDYRKLARNFMERQHVFYHKIDVFHRPAVLWNGLQANASAATAKVDSAPASTSSTAIAPATTATTHQAVKGVASESHIAVLLFGNPDEQIDMLMSEYQDCLLTAQDTIIYLNTLAAAVRAVRSFYDTYCLHPSASKEEEDLSVGRKNVGKEEDISYVHGKYPTLTILAAEYLHCLNEYEEAFSLELKRLLSIHWFLHLQQPFHSFCSR